MLSSILLLNFNIALFFMLMWQWARNLVKSRESAMQGWRRIPAGCQAWIPGTGRDNWYQGTRETQVFLTIEIISRRLSTKSTDLWLSMEIPQKCFNKAWERGQLSPQDENSIRRWLRNDSKPIKMISLGKMYWLPKKRTLWEPWAFLLIRSKDVFSDVLITILASFCMVLSA